MIRKIDQMIVLLIKAIMGSSTLLLSVVTFYQVISRFILKTPIAWGQDIIRLCFVYLVFWGGAYCVREREHLNIDIMLTMVSPKIRKWMELVINVILCFFFAFLIYYGTVFMISGSSQSAPYLSIPMSYYYLALPSSAVLMLYFQIQNIYLTLRPNKEVMGGKASC
ncbi:TRAP transporter small permease [Fusibacter paucivorans]|uniref:TRAP transporter small permease n=1 Tax=Fusibacter paucivorans TaxID=76009 RepID=A0ABS5PJI7_9FIRM|nr:TRAP transporter small permease [Fusibacter paucivorans]MBS7525278.1 TRAP transporter small permease [Fusibacter paucivorans]